MKRIAKMTVKVLLVALCCLMLTSCLDRLKVKATLTGTVEEVLSPASFMLSIKEASGTKLAGKIEVQVIEKDTVSIKAGDKVTVGFDGGVFESAPPFIQGITVEKAE